MESNMCPMFKGICDILTDTFVKWWQGSTDLVSYWYSSKSANPTDVVNVQEFMDWSRYLNSR